MTKRCSTCKEIKPLAEFGKHSAYRDGLKYSCRVCINRGSAKWARENRETCRVRKANWCKANPEKHSASCAKWYQANSDKVRENSAKWYLDNPQKARETRAKWAKENPEIKRAMAAKHRSENPEKHRARYENWRKSNPEKHRSREAKRNAAKLFATPGWVNFDEIAFTYALAQIKTLQTGIEHEVDHIVPLQSNRVCGLHVDYNLQVITRKLNCEKSNRYWPQMP